MRTIKAGESADYTVKAVFDAGYTGTVGLTIKGLPSGATALFDPKSLSPSGAQTSQLEIFTNSSTPEGSYPLIITGDDGETRQTAKVTLVVEKEPPVDATFELSAEPDEIEVEAGEAATYNVTANFDDNYNGTVGLSVEGLPLGATAVFNPQNLSPSGAQTSQLEIFTNSSTPEGSYPLIITGNDGDSERTVTVMLNVVREVESGFELYIEPDEVELQPGEIGQAEVSADFLGDCTGPIFLDIDGASSRAIRDITGMSDGDFQRWDNPDAIGARLSQTELNTEGRNNSDATLEVKVGSEVPPGAYDVVVAGVGRDLCEDEQQVVLTVLVGEVPLAVEKRQSKSSLTPGMTQVYTLRVRNESRVAVTGLEIKDVLDSRLTYVRDTSRVTPTISNNTCTWAFDDLDAGEEIQFKVTTTVSDFLRAGARISNGFEVRVDQSTQPLTSNTVTAVLGYISVDPDELRVTKRKIGGRPRIGGILTYRIEVENVGAGPVFDVRLIDDPPVGFKIPAGKSTLDGQLTADPVRSGGKYSWNLGNLAPGQRTVITYQMVIGTNADSGENKNCAEATGVDGGGNRASGTDCAIVSLGGGDVEWLGQITAKTFLDLDGSGTRNGADQPLEGVEIILVPPGLKQGTDEKGETLFAELRSKDYMVALNTRTLDAKYRFSGTTASQLVKLLEGEKAEVFFLIHSVPTEGFLKIDITVERTK